MTVTKSFQFAGAEHEQNRAEIKAHVGTEEFTLRNDLSGIELLEHIAASSGGPGSTRGVSNFLRRVVREEDWDRFVKACEPAVPDEIGAMAGDLIDAYSTFPTTQAESSSGG